MDAMFLSDLCSLIGSIFVVFVFCMHPVEVLIGVFCVI